MADEVRQVPATELDEHCAKRCECATDDPYIRGADASMITLNAQPYWSVEVAIAQFLADDPVEDCLRQQIASALRAVRGAETVWEEDREVWGVSGNPSGEALVRAAAEVVDRLAARMPGFVESTHIRWPEF